MTMFMMHDNAGAGIELFMIRVRIGQETFYDTAVRLEAKKRAKEAENTTTTTTTTTTSSQ